jgi:hypothetical protein
VHCCDVDHFGNFTEGKPGLSGDKDELLCHGFEDRFKSVAKFGESRPEWRS